MERKTARASRIKTEGEKSLTLKSLAFGPQFLAQARHSLGAHHLPRIERCLKMLDEKGIWWRPHRTSNSVGNLVLHLAGNVHQWINSGLGGALDTRRRDLEFTERGPIPRRRLLTRLRSTVAEASDVLSKLTRADLARTYTIQGFRVTGLEAVFHVAEHFAYHSGQIIFVTKLKRQKDLGFTRLPGEEPRKSRGRNLPAV